jgi:hypothetical protein
MTDDRTAPRPHDPWTYWQDDDSLPSGGRIVLPAGASEATIVYAHTTGPQCVSIVVLPGETDEQAGIAWIAEVSAATGCPHRLIYVGRDDEAAADARARALFAGV